MARIREHRRVENTEDLTQWDWGSPPDELEPKIVAQLKERVSEIAREIHEQSCALGAATALEELAENGFFLVEGTTDNGLLFVLQVTDEFCIYDELDIVNNALLFEDPQEFSAHLRRLADAIDAASPLPLAG